MMRRPTIKDVARVAGVTYPTVSRVLSGKPYVAIKTRQRVQQVIDELGYKPSAAARSMVTQRSYMLAMLVPHLSDANFGTLFAGAERIARMQGYSVLVTDYAAAFEAHGLLSEHKADGAILVEPERIKNLKSTLISIPTVRLDDVPVDNFDGARAIGLHLQVLGHRRVVLIGGPSDDAHAKGRFEGLRSVFENVVWLPNDWNALGGFQLTAQALALGASALCGANDHNALGILHALQQLGLHVPTDISVTGFDDIPIARFFSPALTTVFQPLELQGERAAQLLLDFLHGVSRDQIVPERLELVIRDSTGPPKNN